jgi:hypothetical protein
MIHNAALDLPVNSPHQEARAVDRSVTPSGKSDALLQFRSRRIPYRARIGEID